MTDKNAIFWYDLETTGFSPVENGIHQLAGIFEIDGKVMKTINIKMNVLPTKLVSESAFTFFMTDEEKQKLKDNNILESDRIKKYQTAEEGFAEFETALNEFKGTKFMLAGFNNKSFDNQFLRELFIDNKAGKLAGEMFNGENLDVMIEYKSMLEKYTKLDRYNRPFSPQKIPKHIKTPNIKLETLANHYGIEINAHDGLSDIKATRELYYKVLNPPKEVLENADKKTDSQTDQ